MSVETVLRGIGRFISEFFRLILFFASLMFLATSIILMMFIHQSRISFNLISVKEVDLSLFVFTALAIYLILLSILGVLGSFFASQTSMKWFACMTSLNVLIGVGVLMFAAPKLEGSSDKMEKNLEGLQADYDWLHHSTVETEKSATNVWDTIQIEQHCCGLKSPEDWAKYRLDKKNVDIYPTSCCQNETKALEVGYCKLDAAHNSNIWTTGCMTRYNEVSSVLSLMVTFMICLNMVLSVLACIVLMCKPRDHYYDYS